MEEKLSKDSIEESEEKVAQVANEETSKVPEEKLEEVPIQEASDNIQKEPKEEIPYTQEESAPNFTEAASEDHAKKPVKEDKGFQIVEKDIPIIISAPHSAKQLRNGKIQAKEAQTDYFATMISTRENVSCIYKTTFLNDDANADKDSAYKIELKNFIETKGIKYLFDLHTMSDKRLPDVCIAINGGKNIQNRYTELQDIISAFNSNGISTVTVDEPFKASDPNCISNYIATNCNIPCFHIEINKKFSSIFNIFSKSSFNKQAIEDSLCRAIQILKTRM